LEKKPRVPAYRPGDLVQFQYDGDNRKKIKRVVCIESLHYENESKEWDGWYKAHLFYDETGNAYETGTYKLEHFIPGSNEDTSKGRKLIARIGED
jgi:hypothetical protein